MQLLVIYFQHLHEHNCVWLPSYIKAVLPVLEIFKMAGYFLDGPRMYKSFRK